MNLLELFIRPQPRIISGALALQVLRGRPGRPAMPRVPLMQRRFAVPPKDPIRSDAVSPAFAAAMAYDEEMLDIPAFLLAQAEERS